MKSHLEVKTRLSPFRAVVGGLALAIVLGPAAASARAAEVWELLSFKQQGLSDDVLVALIESDGSVFHLTAKDVQTLHDKGLSDKVLVAMLKTATKAVDPVAPPAAPAAPGSEPPPAADESTPAPLTVAPPLASDETAAQDDAPVANEPPPVTPVVIEVPVLVPVSVPSHHAVAPSAPPAPVYWGFGGQRRPDAWQDAPSKPPVPPKSGGSLVP
jgi:hypothetical protein